MDSEAEVMLPTREPNWHAIDIYLFSNGQENSPPRKYHLKSDVLYQWDSTMASLAHLHYGSEQSSLDLYTLDGRRIRGPLELKDGTPYVAVLPREEFVNSGYEKYVMKASRSREKRQAKRTSAVTAENGNAGTAATEVTLSTLHVSTVTELTTIKTPDDNNIAMESALVRPESKQKIEKSEPQPFPKSIITPRSSKAYPRRERRQSSVQRAVFVKDDTSSNSRQKSSITSKNTVMPQKKGLTKIPIKINETGHGVVATPVKYIKDKTIPLPSAEPPSIPATVAFPLEPLPLIVTAPSTTCHKETTPSDKCLVTETAPNPDKEIVVLCSDKSAIKLVESELAEQVNIKREYGVDKIVSCHVITTTFDEAVQTENEQHTTGVNVPSVTFSNFSKINEIPPTSDVTQCDVVRCDIPLESNYIAVTNKGDAVNVNLNMDPLNQSTIGPNNLSMLNRELLKCESAGDVFKQLGQSKHDAGTIMQSKSFHSLVYHSEESYAKVVVMQCGCCGTNTTMPRVDTMPVYKDENGFFILMPTPVQVEARSCNGDTDKKNVCDVCLKDLTAATITLPTVTRDIGMVVTSMETVVKPIYEGQQKDNSYQKSFTKSQSIACVYDCEAPPSQVLEKVVTTESHIESYSIDMYTQTDWCNTWMQMKRQDDGHYTFYLPPLDVLRFYSF